MTIRVLVADDEELVRTGLRLILDTETDIEVVGEASNGRQVVEMSTALQPDVVLLDIRMPEMDGLEATRLLLGGGSTSKVVVLTTFDLDQYVYDALQAGASGFLLKDAPAHQLVDAVRAAAAGDALLAPSVTRRLITEFARRGPRVAPSTVQALTERELEVLRLLARGLSNAEIAVELFIAEGTVKTHVARLLSKLGVRDRVQAVVLAYQSGLAS
jgi:DNA-binding NarL/FixJ family response regulator